MFRFLSIAALLSCLLGCTVSQNQEGSSITTTEDNLVPCKGQECESYQIITSFVFSRLTTEEQFSQVQQYVGNQTTKCGELASINHTYAFWDWRERSDDFQCSTPESCLDIMAEKITYENIVLNSPLKNNNQAIQTFNYGKSSSLHHRLRLFDMDQPVDKTGRLLVVLTNAEVQPRTIIRLESFFRAQNVELKMIEIGDFFQLDSERKLLNNTLFVIPKYSEIHSILPDLYPCGKIAFDYKFYATVGICSLIGVVFALLVCCCLCYARNRRRSESMDVSTGKERATLMHNTSHTLAEVS